RPVHCIHPEFLKEQLDISLNNLNLSGVDVMYLHNVFESQGAVLPQDVFEKRLTTAFEFMVFIFNVRKKQEVKRKLTHMVFQLGIVLEYNQLILGFIAIYKALLNWLRK